MLLVSRILSLFLLTLMALLLEVEQILILLRLSRKTLIFALDALFVTLI